MPDKSGPGPDAGAGDAPDSAAPDPALLERLRQSGLRLDRDARWWHEGEPVRHAGTAAAFHRWLDRLDDGRYVVRLDERRYAYVEVEDTPYVARSARVAGGRVWLQLSDQTEEPLDPATLRARGDELLCAVKSGRMACRLAPQAAYALAAHLVDDGGAPALALGGRRWRIPPAT